MIDVSHTSTQTCPFHAGAPACPSATKVAPHVRGLPLLGLLPSFLRDAPSEVARVAHAHPDQIPIVHLGPARVHVVSKPEHVEYVFQAFRTYEKGGAMWTPVRRVLGDGLVASNGEVWQRSRRLVQPLFGPKQLASFAGVMASLADRAVSRFAALAREGRPVDIEGEMMTVTQDVVLETLFGTSLDRADNDVLCRGIREAFDAISLRIFLNTVPERIPLPGDGVVRRAVERVDRIVLRLVRDRRLRGEAREDLLTLLLRARDDETGTGMSDRQLRDELVTLFVAGNETSALAMAWILYALSENPEVEARLRAEVAEVLGGRLATAEELPKLVYTKMVIQEAMRLHPPSWVMPRVAVRDDAIDGFAIPAGATVLLSPYATHRDPALWERPEVFDPERFTAARSAGRHRYAYYPFSGGARQCLGHGFAMMELQILLATFVQRLRARLPPGHPPVVPRSAPTLRTRHGLRMALSLV